MWSKLKQYQNALETCVSPSHSGLHIYGITLHRTVDIKYSIAHTIVVVVVTHNCEKLKHARTGTHTNIEHWQQSIHLKL